MAIAALRKTDPVCHRAGLVLLALLVNGKLRLPADFLLDAAITHLSSANADCVSAASWLIARMYEHMLGSLGSRAASATAALLGKVRHLPADPVDDV